MDIQQVLKDNTQLKQVLLFLYGYQTQEEQLSESTVEQNGVGFNMIDATILSSFAEQIIAGRDLSEKQYNLARLRLGKYQRQLDSGAWQSIVIPTVTHVNGAKSKYADVTVDFQGQEQRLADMLRKPKIAGGEKVTGVLDIDPNNGGLMFTPNVYPSKQIKSAGFTSYTGGAWHQYHPKVYQTVVDDVRKLFGNITVTNAVTQALQPKPILSLPEWVDTAMFASLFEYQKQAIQIVASSERMLLALAPRLGKSVVTIIAANMLRKKRILIISPLSLLQDWARKIARWSFGDKASIVYKKNLLVPGAKWTITNYDTTRLHTATFYEQWDLIIIDESLLIKNRKAKRTEVVKQVVLNSKVPHVWMLSGKPFAKLYADLWAQFNILDPVRFSSYWKFAERYCIREENQWSKYNLVGNQPDGAQRIKEDYKDIYFSLLAEDVLDLPPLEPENLGVRMSKRQDKLYKQMEDEFLAEIGDDESIFAGNVLTQMLRLNQIASNPLLLGGPDDSAKWEAAIEMLQYEPHPVIIWTNYIKTAEELRARLMSKEWAVALLTGATPQSERDQIVQDFQNDRIDVLVAHPAVGKYGLDLYNAKAVIYLERDYNTDNYYQSLNRVRQVQQKVAPHIVHLLSERVEGGDTIDHVVDMVLRTSTDETKKLTAGRLKSMLLEKSNGQV